MKISRPLVVLDLETTGTWIEKDKIVEIALIKLLLDGSRDSYKQRVNPGVPIPQRVSEIIGIRDEDVIDCPPFKQIAAEVLAFIGDADLGGFNVERFDLLVMEREIFDAGLKFEWRTRAIFDAQKIYHLHEKRTLKAAYQFYCSKELVDAHTAMADADATVDILAAQIDKYGKPELGIESLRDFNYEKIDDFFDNEKKFRWWNGELYPVFGKYAKRVSLKEIAKKERSYLEWLLNTDFPKPVKEMIKGILEGRFPTPPERPVNQPDPAAR